MIIKKKLEEKNQLAQQGIKMNLLGTNRGHLLIAIILICALTGLTFFNSLSNGFTNWDDPRFVVENYLITKLSLKNLGIMFSTVEKYEQLYIPLVWVSLAVDYALWGPDDPFGYHLTNLILHLANAILVFFLVYLLTRKSITAAIVAGLLFGIHPLHVESVAWITERKDVLSTFFFLISILLYLYWRDKKRIYLYGLSLFVFILACMSKPMVVTLPVLLIIIQLLQGEKWSSRLLLDKISFFGVTFIFIYITLLGQGHLIVKGRLNLSYLVMVPPYTVIFYLKKALLPIKLSALYPFPTNVSMADSDFYIPLIIFFATLVCLAISFKFTRKILLGFLFFLVALSPQMKIIPIGTDITADRFFYIPSIGLFFLAGLGIDFLYRRFYKSIAARALLIVAVSAVILIFSYLAHERNKVWKSGGTLWEDVLNKYPDIEAAYTNLGSYYLSLAKAKNMDKELIEKGRYYLKKVLEANPDNHMAMVNLGNLELDVGDVEKAIEYYEKALDIAPGNKAYIKYNMGNACAKKEDYEGSIRWYEKAIAEDPLFYKSYINMGTSYRKLNQYDKAAELYWKALEINPESGYAYYNLGIAYEEKKEFEKAAQFYRRAFDLLVNDEDLRAMGDVQKRLMGIEEKLGTKK